MLKRIPALMLVFSFILAGGCQKTDTTPETDVSGFIAVTDITGVPSTFEAGTTLTLTGTVAPDNATNKTITWSIKSAGTTGAALQGGNKLTAENKGTVTVTAAITKGVSGSDDYTKVFSVTVTPVLPNPIFNDNTKRLYKFLSDNYGENIISGQMDTAWTTNSSMDMIARVYNDTGKYPAIKGFDFIDLPHSWGKYGRDQVDEAIEWWDGKNKMNGKSPAEKLLPGQPDIHGIVTFCWHWRVPQKTGANMDFYTSNTDFRIPWENGKLDTESAGFQIIKSDLDKVADLLQLLKDKDIPVLWRPLHEAGGGWFWWGANGVSDRAARYIALWEYMYDYFTNTRALNNLIWVWNGQHKDWFPNPATVDIVGYDVYTNANTSSTAQDYTSQKSKFTETKEMVPAKNLMVALTENGAIPDPDNCFAAGAMWSWFMTWNDGYGSKQGDLGKENFWTGEYHNTQAHKEKVYNHERVITLDKLPDITNYPFE